MLCFKASITRAVEFDIPAIEMKSGLGCFCNKRFGQMTEMRFNDRSAIIANHKLRPLMTMVAVTRYIGVETLDPVNKPVFGQKFDGTVGRRRFGVIQLFP